MGAGSLGKSLARETGKVRTPGREQRLCCSKLVKTTWFRGSRH
jgi:hypothetical protein